MPSRMSVFAVDCSQFATFLPAIVGYVVDTAKFIDPPKTSSFFFLDDQEICLEQPSLWANHSGSGTRG